MGLASLVVGVFAVIFAAICAAPFLGLFALLGAPVAMTGFCLAVAGLIAELRRRRAGRSEPDELRHSLIGLALCGAAALFSGAIFAIKGPM